MSSQSTQQQQQQQPLLQDQVHNPSSIQNDQSSLLLNDQQNQQVPPPFPGRFPGRSSAAPPVAPLPQRPLSFDSVLLDLGFHTHTPPLSSSSSINSFLSPRPSIVLATPPPQFHPIRPKPPTPPRTSASLPSPLVLPNNSIQQDDTNFSNPNLVDIPPSHSESTTTNVTTNEPPNEPTVIDIEPQPIIISDQRDDRTLVDTTGASTVNVLVADHRLLLHPPPPQQGPRFIINWTPPSADDIASNDVPSRITPTINHDKSKKDITTKIVTHVVAEVDATNNKRTNNKNDDKSALIRAGARAKKTSTSAIGKARNAFKRVSTLPLTLTKKLGKCCILIVVIILILLIGNWIMLYYASSRHNATKNLLTASAAIIEHANITTSSTKPSSIDSTTSTTIPTVTTNIIYYRVWPEEEIGNELTTTEVSKRLSCLSDFETMNLNDFYTQDCSDCTQDIGIQNQTVVQFCTLSNLLGSAITTRDYCSLSVVICDSQGNITGLTTEYDSSTFANIGNLIYLDDLDLLSTSGDYTGLYLPSTSATNVTLESTSDIDIPNGICSIDSHSDTGISLTLDATDGTVSGVDNLEDCNLNAINIDSILVDGQLALNFVNGSFNIAVDYWSYDGVNRTELVFPNVTGTIYGINSESPRFSFSFPSATCIRAGKVVSC